MFQLVMLLKNNSVILLFMYKQPRNVFKILDHKPVYLFLQWDCNFGCAIQAGRVGNGQNNVISLLNTNLISLFITQGVNKI